LKTRDDRDRSPMVMNRDDSCQRWYLERFEKLSPAQSTRKQENHAESRAPR
jgi:hypothetical protein